MNNQANKVEGLTTKELIPSFWLSQILIFLPGLFFLWLFYLRKGYTLDLFFAVVNFTGIGIIGTLGAILGIGLQWIGWKIFSLSAFDDGGINRLLLTLPLGTLVPMFAFGAFAEELLVRGVLQTGIVPIFGPLMGLVLTSVLFTGMHFRYIRKPVLLGGVFILSLLLGALYLMTGTLWTSIWAHFIYNLGAAWLAQKYYLPLFSEEINPEK